MPPSEYSAALLQSKPAAIRDGCRSHFSASVFNASPQDGHLLGDPQPLALQQRHSPAVLAAPSASTREKAQQ
ncbi:hypothetical protein [Cryptosporangium arvum]|uniref:Uncharacterized protein n=1 Tax=Cryptosporangium arvum DSM 44712 TaxID=927661 RepID=A0A010YP84_9ACTN|nr:hypothetical protein [Cryptosporangium arvum]EXG82000.1 hypothetical protein CryarDRAFT_3129 [Cryptosporangium arvum DSM 44712]